MPADRKVRLPRTATAARSNRPIGTAGRYLSSLARIWKYPRVSQLNVVINPRLKSTIARWLPPSDAIEVSVTARSRGTSAFHKILCHEAAHVVVWNRFGRTSRPHGREWAALMRAAGVEPRATLMRCGASRRSGSGTRVRHVCTVCHFSALAKRVMPQWRCPECRLIGLQGKLRTERIVSR